MNDWIIYMGLVLVSLGIHQTTAEIVKDLFFPYKSENNFQEKHSIIHKVVDLFSIIMFVIGSGLFSYFIPTIFNDLRGIVISDTIILGWKLVFMLLYIVLTIVMNWRFGEKHKTHNVITYRRTVAIWKVCSIVYSALVIISSVSPDLTNRSIRLGLGIMYSACVLCGTIIYYQFERVNPREQVQECGLVSRTANYNDIQRNGEKQEFKAKRVNRELKNENLKKIIKKARLKKRIYISIMILVFLNTVLFTCLSLLFSDDVSASYLLGFLCIVWVVIIICTFRYNRLPGKELICRLDPEFDENKKILLGGMKAYITKSFLVICSGYWVFIIERKDILHIFWKRRAPTPYTYNMWGITVETRQRKYSLVANGADLTDDRIDHFAKLVMGDLHQ